MTRRLMLALMGMLLVPARVLARLPSQATTPAVLNSEDKVNAWLRSIEREVGVGKDGVKGMCEATGQPYQELMWNPDGTFADTAYGPLNHRPLGYYSPMSIFTPEMAWAHWAAGFAQYREHHRGKIHWRIRPELISHAETGTFLVYARAFLEKN